VCTLNAGAAFHRHENQRGCPSRCECMFEGAVQLIDRRAPKPAVEDSESLAHAFLPRDFFFLTSVQHRRGRLQGKITSSLGAKRSGLDRDPFRKLRRASVLAALPERFGSAAPILANTRS